MLLSGALVVSLAVQSGAYYPRAWGPSALATLAVAAGALVVTGRVPLQRREWWLVATALGWLGWVAVGATRPEAATGGMPEVERGALYVAVVWTALVVLRRDTVRACLAGILGGTLVVAFLGLGAELFPGSQPPDAFEGRLLFQPLGYANAAGILAALGCVVAVGFAAHAATPVTRRVAATGLVPLAAALALTGSRGALAAFAAGLVVLLVLDERRWAMIVALPAPLLAAVIVSRTHVADSHASTGAVTHDGRLVAAVLVLLAVAAFGVAHFAPRDSTRLRVPRPLLLVPGLLALASAALWAPHALGDRVAYWRAAWLDAHAHPLLGSGPGSFAAEWLRYRDAPLGALDAHNLYLETLAELGPLGLAMLVAFLLLPFAALATARRREPLSNVIAAAYAAYLVHAGLDWDWEMPAVTATALVLGCTLVVAARRERVERHRPAALAAAAAACALASLAAIGASIGNNALAGASRAAARGDWPAAQALAAKAARWQPWSSEPLLLRRLSVVERTRTRP
jgi:hypothetical protein